MTYYAYFRGTIKIPAKIAIWMRRHLPRFLWPWQIIKADEDMPF